MQTSASSLEEVAGGGGVVGGASRSIAPRARSACKLCRSKKVRCDSRDGKRCSICAFENVPCVLVPKQSRKSVSSPPNHSTPVHPTNSSGFSRKSKLTSGHVNTNQDAGPSTSTSSQRSKNQGSTQSTMYQEPSMASFDLGDAQEEPPPSLSDPVNSADQDQVKQWAEPTPMNYSYTMSRWPNLPDYVRPLPASLESDDIEYLHKKGAFTLPDRPLMEECLRCYLLYIHPLYPTVDIVEVQSIINRGGEGHQLLSLLLLQALIFAGSMWADVRLVRNAGFLTRKAFRLSWHRKIRLLYDMDYEEDRICLVQSLLLWAFWWRGTNERKDSWHWIGVAYSIARTVDLPQEPPVAGVDGGSPTAQQQRKHRRRLWWALHTREVISSIGMSRAPRIKPSDHNVAMLCLDDFGLDDDGEEEEGTPQASLMSLPPPSREQRQALARVTVEFTKLIDIFGRILAAACPENAAGRTAVLYSAQQMEGSNHVASKRQLNIEDLNVCQRELMDWQRQLGEDLWWQVGGVLPFDPQPPWYKAELCHRGLLAMLYHLALMTIHRPQMLPAEASSPTTVTTATTTSPKGTTTAEQYRKDTSRAIVRSCAQEITKIAMDFFRADLITYLSATVVSCLMPASIHHVFDTFSEDTKLRADANRRLEECRVMLHSLSEQQFASAWILQTIDHINGRIKLISNGGNGSGNTQKRSSQQQQHGTESRRVPTQSSYGELSTPLSSIDVYPESLVIDQDQDHHRTETQNFPVLNTATNGESPNVLGPVTDMRTTSNTNTNNNSNKPMDRSSDSTVFSDTYHSSSRQDWTTAASFWNSQQPDVGGDGNLSQLPLLSDPLMPFQPDLMTNAEALEEMWMDFARVPENMAGLPGL